MRRKGVAGQNVPSVRRILKEIRCAPDQKISEIVERVVACAPL
jgi:hypothetical protein